uniref:ATF7-interacting protein protein binding domain-containing protein n=1 Tax=Terrapene triunguis TaxID=2587831 RepID=A0A674K9M9_9SAUR
CSCPGRSIPLRARKTMTPSSRKQVEMLNKTKNISGQGKILNGLHTEDHHVQLNTVDINCRSNDSVKGSSLTESKTDTFPEKSDMLPQKLTASIQGFSVNSKVNEEVKQCSYDKNFDQNCQEESQEPPHEKSCNKNSDAKQFLNAGCLQDILHKWYENELNSPSSKKRVCSESKEDSHCKRFKTADENKKENICTVPEKEEKFLGKVKHLIQKRVDILNNDVFNHKLESLNGRVDQTQCRKKHEEIAITFLKKVSKLERRINTVIAFQKKILSKMVTSKV